MQPARTRPAAGVPRLGRCLLAAGAILLGAAGLGWPSSGGWQRIAPLNHLPAAMALSLYVLVSAVAVAGGIVLLWPAAPRRMAAAGAAALVAVFSAGTLMALPAIALGPGVFNSWGNAGEMLSELAGAVLLLVLLRGAGKRARILGWVAYWAFAVCVVTYMLEQWVYFAPTVALVPGWIPPGPGFWAAATTACFGMAAAALLARRAAVAAARLLAAMLLGFALLVWVPILSVHPRVASNWSELAETVTMAAAAWLAGDWLRAH